MDLKIKRLPWARSIFLDYRSDHIAITAGLGAGKSHAGFQWHLLRCLHNRDSKNSAVVLPTYAEIKSFGIPRYQEILIDAGLQEGKHFKVYTGQTDPCIHFKFLDHTVRFISGDRPARLRAYEYSHALADECGDLKPEVFKLLPTRVRCRRAKKRQILWAGAPQGLNDFAEKFDSDSQEGWTHDTETDHHKVEVIEGVEIRTRRLRIRTDDNPHLPPGYIADLMSAIGSNPNLVKSYRYGFFCSLFEGTAYANYLSEKHDTEGSEPDPHAPLDLTFDFNANPLSWVSAQMVRYEDGIRRLTAMREAEDGLSQLDDAAVDFALKHPVHEFANTPIEIYGDSSGHARSHKTKHTDYKALAKHLRAIGYKNVTVKALKFNPLESITVEAVNKWFSEDLIRIDKTLKKLKRSFMQTCWKKNQRKLDKPNGEDWTHFSDAWKYLIFAKVHKAGSKVRSFNVKYE